MVLGPRVVLFGCRVGSSYSSLKEAMGGDIAPLRRLSRHRFLKGAIRKVVKLRLESLGFEGF